MTNANSSVKLSSIIEGLLRALQEAKQAGDMESSRLYELYRSKKELALFCVPAFTIEDVEVDLKFVIDTPMEESKKKVKPDDLRVKIQSEVLKGMEPHQISAMKLKFTLANLRVIEP